MGRPTSSGAAPRGKDPKYKVRRVKVHHFDINPFVTIFTAELRAARVDVPDDAYLSKTRDSTG